MFRPLRRHGSSRRTRRRILVVAVILALIGGSTVTWTGIAASRLSGVVDHLRADGQRLQGQLRSSDLIGAAATLTRLRQEADQARDMASGPQWTVTGWLPGLGRNVQALRTVTSAVAGVLDAARPLEAILPRLDPKAQKASRGRVDVDALAQVASALPPLSHAVDAAYAQMQLVDPVPLTSSVGSAVRTLQSGLGAIKGPLAGASGAMDVVPAMLGASGPRTFVVLLEQDAEARGTGGLVGSFAVVKADQGRLTLLQAQSRLALQNSGAIPVAGLPDGLQALWGKDLSEWAGLNLSPHFPYTGQLVAAGWAAQHRTPTVDFVVGMDEYVVAALLAGTGPVTVDGVTLTSANAAQMLSRGVYAKISDPRRIDAITAGLVQQVFGRISTGQFSLAPIVAAVTDRVAQRRLTIWAADPGVESKLAALSVGGALPDAPGPFAMAVVNNGGGNKLDAYLKVNTAYDPGSCEQNVRLGHITVTLANTAPTSGLPAYVSARSDLLQEHKSNPTVGSNRLIVDVYGPVGATSPLADLDGEAVATTTGLDRNHPVWRVMLDINPGQTRTLDVLVTAPETGGAATASPPPQVLAQPMAIPAKATAPTQLSSCPAG